MNNFFAPLPGRLIRCSTIAMVLMLALRGPSCAAAGDSRTNLVGEVRMATPPAVSLIGPVSPVPTVAGANWLPPSDAAFQMLGARSEPWGDGYPQGYFRVARGVTGAYTEIPCKIRFVVDAAEFEILTLGTAPRYRLMVEGEYVSLTELPSPPADGNFYWIHVNFPDRRPRSVTVEALGLAFGGVAVPAGGRILPPERPLGTRCVVLGDSYTEGLLSYAQRLGALTGWEMWSPGVGGVGYMNPGPPGREPFLGRIQSDVITNHPDVVIVAGGINDGSYPPEVLGAAAGTLYDALAAGLPSSRIVVIGPWWPRGVVPQFIVNGRDALRAAAAARGLTFIDPIGASSSADFNAGWITGTGTVAEPRGDGNADLYISADRTHPTDLGHQYLAVRLAEALRGLSVPDPTPRVTVRAGRSLLVGSTPGRRCLLQTRGLQADAVWTPVGIVTAAPTPVPFDDFVNDTTPGRLFRAILLP